MSRLALSLLKPGRGLSLAEATGFTLTFWAGVLIVGGWVAVALLAPWIAPYDPIMHNLPEKLQGPSLAHLLGTDNFGRDLLSRVIYGARIDLQMGVIGVIFPFMIGTVVGAIAGYSGRWVDAALMRLIDIVLAFPFLVLMLAIIAFLKPGLVSFYIAITLVGWVSYARLVRVQVLVLKNSDFVVAARSLGFGPLRILFRHDPLQERQGQGTGGESQDRVRPGEAGTDVYRAPEDGESRRQLDRSLLQPVPQCLPGGDRSLLSESAGTFLPRGYEEEVDARSGSVSAALPASEFQSYTLICMRP